MITKANNNFEFSSEDFKLCILDLKNEINDLKNKVKQLEENKANYSSIPAEVNLLRVIGPGLITKDDFLRMNKQNDK